MTATGLRHDAFVYDSDAGFVERMTPFVIDALDAGEAAVAVTTPGNCALLREALGASAERVSFVHSDDWYQRPITTIAGYDRTLRTHEQAGAPAVRVIGEVSFGSTPRELREWTAYEALLNHAFADRAAWIMCPYDARRLPDEVLEHAWHSHAGVLTDDWNDSPHYDDSDAFARAALPEPEPVEGLIDVPFEVEPQAFRTSLRRYLEYARVPQERADALLSAAGEILANAARHAEGVRSVRIGLVDDRFVCEITDAGPGFDDQLAGYLPPSEHAAASGLWVARQLTWRLELLPAADGLTVRLWV
jgi:anti-sigma regulatory factor (Ser/Thr protein kinase)